MALYGCSRCARARSNEPTRRQALASAKRMGYCANSDCYYKTQEKAEMLEWLRGPLITPIIGPAFTFFLGPSIEGLFYDQKIATAFCLVISLFLAYLVSREPVESYLERYSFLRWPFVIVIAIGVSIVLAGVVSGENESSDQEETTTEVIDVSSPESSPPESIEIEEADLNKCKSTPAWKHSAIPIVDTTYEVQAGDTLRCIALAHHADLEKVFAHNRAEIPYPDEIQPGDIVNIPR